VVIAAGLYAPSTPHQCPRRAQPRVTMGRSGATRPPPYETACDRDTPSTALDCHH
jgi:hypothetical protein